MCTMKNKKAPSTTHSTPKVAAFVAACDRVKISGRRSRPTALMMLKAAPIRASSATIQSTISVMLNDNTLFDIFSEGYRADKGQDCKQQHNFNERARI